MQEPCERVCVNGCRLMPLRLVGISTDVLIPSPLYVPTSLSSAGQDQNPFRAGPDRLVSARHPAPGWPPHTGTDNGTTGLQNHTLFTDPSHRPLGRSAKHIHAEMYSTAQPFGRPMRTGATISGQASPRLPVRRQRRAKSVDSCVAVAVECSADYARRGLKAHAWTQRLIGAQRGSSSMEVERTCCATAAAASCQVMKLDLISKQKQAERDAALIPYLDITWPCHSSL